MNLFTKMKVLISCVRHLSLRVSKPTSSEVLTVYLLHSKEPPWTSYFVKNRCLLINRVVLSQYYVTGATPWHNEKLAKPFYVKGANEQACHLMVSDQLRPWTPTTLDESQYRSVTDDQFGMSNFNWEVGSSNYQILRTGCYPYIKYHCSKKIKEDLESSDKFMRFIKIANLGIPCILYGLAATQLIRHQEVVYTSKGPVTIYFLLEEHKGSLY